MAAAMNGMALHGGLIPYGGTFLCFSDYARPAIRLASLMGIRSIFVMTHDSIGLGEDGPTHQPVEHLAALRAIPNHLVFRPADAVETAECWQIALESTKTPSTLALTRQNLPALRTEYVDGEPLRATAPTSWRRRRRGRGDDLRHRLGGRDRARGARSCSRSTAIRPASSRCPASSCSSSRATTTSAADHRQRAGQGRHRGRHPPGLGPLHRRRRHLRRHAPASAPAARSKQLYQHFGITAEAVVEAVEARTSTGRADAGDRGGA